jgi:hypothetical protein
MRLIYRIRGYDKQGSALLFEEDLPPDLAVNICRMIGNREDPELIWPHHLTQAQIHKVALALAHPLEADSLDYFVESSADWETIKREKRRASAMP